MNSFKDLAYTILKESGKPLHSKEITKRALEHGLVTEGKTPEATMNAQLVVDINTKKEKSRFIKTDPSTSIISSPAFKNEFTYPIPIPTPRLGENEPLVTEPISLSLYIIL